MKTTVHSELTIEDRMIFQTLELSKWETYEITWNEIITIIFWEVKEKTFQVLKTLESSVYHKWNSLEATQDTFMTISSIKNLNQILDKIDINSEYWEYCRKNWAQLRELWNVDWFEKVDLYRWDQIDYEFNGYKYKFNLWFCWADVDCLFHNQHDFMEIHTNYAWIWNMQKSLDWTEKRLCETVSLWVGASHRFFNIPWEFEENWNPKYPFHRWLWWPKWNIWLVIEKS